MEISQMNIHKVDPYLTWLITKQKSQMRERDLREEEGLTLVREIEERGSKNNENFIYLSEIVNEHI